VRLQGISAILDFLESVVDTPGPAGGTHALEQGGDRRRSPKFLFQKRQIRLAFGRRVGIQEKRAPALLAGKVGHLPTNFGNGCIKPAQADVAPRANEVGNDFNGGHGANNSGLFEQRQFARRYTPSSYGECMVRSLYWFEQRVIDDQRRICGFVITHRQLHTAGFP